MCVPVPLVVLDEVPIKLRVPVCVNVPVPLVVPVRVAILLRVPVPVPVPVSVVVFAKTLSNRTNSVISLIY